ncbi:MAG TPA: hypothetical protein EYP92_02275 [Candidatus Thioglobus sp.]|jgi:hypothetical protein|nr:hypothetical protein [Candidatus Thioglobus sp.]
MIKSIATIAIALSLTGCMQTIDDTLYKYGNGILGVVDGIGTAYACVATGGTVCATGLGVKGYIEGKQEARLEIEARDNRKVIKALADEKAEEKGANVKCSWWELGC